MVTYPSDWKKYEINDVAKTFIGLVTTMTTNYSTSGVRLIRNQDIENNRFVFKENIFLNKEFAEKNKSRMHEIGDIVTVHTGDIGTSSVIDDNLVGSLGFATIVTRVDKKKANPHFISWYFNSPYFKEYIYSIMTGDGRNNLNMKDFNKTIFHLPPLPEQQVIASVLSDFDAHIYNLTDLIEKKKAIRDGALEDLVSGRTRLDGFSGEWETVDLSDFTQINPSSEIPEEFYYVDLESVKGISLTNARKENKKTAPSRAKRLAKRGDVFFQTVRPYQKNNYLFDLKKENYVFSTGYAQLRTINDPQFLFLLIRNDRFVEEVLDNCTGTSYPAINPTTLGKIKIYVPRDLKEQQAIASVLTAMDEEIEALKTEKAKIIQIREGAMDDLLTGRVRLKV